MDGEDKKDHQQQQRRTKSQKQTKTPPSRAVGLEGGRNHVLVFGFCVKPLDVSHHLIGVVKSDMFVVCGFFIFCGCEMTR